MPKHVWGVNYAYQKSVSYSQYSIYKQCQYQWYLNYIKKLKIFKPSVHLTFGTSFHETMQDWLKVMFEESAKKADEMDLAGLLKEEDAKSVSTSNNSPALSSGNKEEEAKLQDLKNLFRKYSIDSLTGITSKEVDFLINFLTDVISKSKGGTTDVYLKQIMGMWNDRTKSIEIKP
jgi:hypothetical protein